MKRKRIVQGSLIAAAALLLAGTVIFFRRYLPDSYLVAEDTPLYLAQTPYVTVHSPKHTDGSVDVSLQTGTRSVQLRLFGVIPVKTVWVKEEAEHTVLVSGAPFGVKLFSDGVMVVGFSDIYTENGYQNPAKNAGIRMGDTVRSVGGQAVADNDDIREKVEASEGRPVSVTFERKGEQKTVFVTPVRDRSTDVYRIGMRVRDSSAGIGTLTCVDPENGTFAGLGHAITDVDTDEIIEVRSGEIAEVDITGVVPSSSGSPGELKGVLSMAAAGDILQNDETGVYGTVKNITYFPGTEMPVAMRQEAVVGDAVVYTCIDGDTPQEYAVTIERISYNESSPNKNMVVRVTDKRLLQETGGIVQGMSGSPIVQNGKLVGAVTHVLVNDPTRGYAIFAENMMETARAVAEEAQQKAA